MELLVNPTSYANALNLIKLGVQQISVGTKEFSTANSCQLSLEEIAELVKYKNKAKILVLVNRIFFEPEIKNLENFLIKLSELDIDGIIYCDYAVNQIIFEQKIKIYQIYNPETLVVNYGQIPFYLENGINEISLARELSGYNINEIIKHKQNMKIQVNVAGYSYMMWSRWFLLSNFAKSHNIKDELLNKKMFLTEPKRENKFIVYEDNSGTHIYTDYNLNLLSELQELYDNGCDTIRIDTFLHNEDWTNEISAIFLKAISLCKVRKLTKEFIDESLQNLIKYDKIQSRGFYHMDKNDLIYLVSDESDK